MVRALRGTREKSQVGPCGYRGVSGGLPGARGAPDWVLAHIHPWASALAELAAHFGVRMPLPPVSHPLTVSATPGGRVWTSGLPMGVVTSVLSCRGRREFRIFLSPRLVPFQVYPTATRALGLGTCSGMARVGALITPFIAQVGVTDGRGGAPEPRAQ